MKISIIIPVYNSEKYIKKLLKSILTQSYLNYEIILVNDGSTDQSYEIIKEYEKKYNCVRVYSHKNCGPGLTRKEGFLKATGDLIFFVDSDDELYDNKVLEKINNIFKDKSIDLLMFEAKQIPDDMKKHKVIYKGDLKRGKHYVQELDDCIVEGSLCLKVFKKEKFDEKFFINSYNYEDVYTTYMYLNNCKMFYYLDEPLYIINRHEENNSLTKNIDINKIIKSIDIIIKISEGTILKRSVELMALNYYLGNIKKIFIRNESVESKKNLYRKLKELRKSFDKNAIQLCKQKFKKKTVYLYLLVKIFV